MAINISKTQTTYYEPQTSQNNKQTIRYQSPRRNRKTVTKPRKTGRNCSILIAPIRISRYLRANRPAKIPIPPNHATVVPNLGKKRRRKESSRTIYSRRDRIYRRAAIELNSKLKSEKVGETGTGAANRKSPAPQRWLAPRLRYP